MVINERIYYQLHASCIPVQGARRSIICDLIRTNYVFIPTDLCLILMENDQLNLNELAQKYGEDFYDTISEYLLFLIKNEYVFESIEGSSFPPLNLSWKSPVLIQNAIVDHDAQSHHDYAHIARQLEICGCEHLELRFFDVISMEKLTGILNHFSQSAIYSIQLLVKHSNENTTNDYLRLVRKEYRIVQVIVHSAPTEGAVEEVEFLIDKNCVYYTKQCIKDETHCGVVSPTYFTVNTTFYTEAQHHNTCLNGKVAIDKKGQLKNCPSMATRFGQANEIADFKTIIETAAFQKIGSISKNDIEICRDCEFRYICTDCRAYTKDDKANGKPAKCTYDPYTATWA